MNLTTSRAAAMARISLVAALFVSLLAPVRPAFAATGTVLLNLDGTTSQYIDRTGAKTLVGTPAFSNRGRAFGARILQSIPTNPALGGFPYGVYGMDEQDQNGDFDYTDAGDTDPVALLDAVSSEGVYNVALSTRLGSVNIVGKVIRTLEGAKARNLRLIVRVIEYQTGGDYNLDVVKTTDNLKMFRQIFLDRPELESVVYAWYSYDEPLVKGVSAETLRQAYAVHKSIFPTVPVFTVYNQNQTLPDNDGNGIGDGFLGELRNQYTAGMADIVGLNVYAAISDVANPFYGYDAISKFYTHARRVVTRDHGVTVPIWAVAQAHGLIRTGYEAEAQNMPEAHQLYRQMNDWLRAGPEAGLPQLDGLLWYSWHFPNKLSATTVNPQAIGDLEGNSQNRAMARAIGRQLKAGKFVTHDLPYSNRKELCLATVTPATDRGGCSTTPVKAPRQGNLNPAVGTITFASSHSWAGEDGVRHVYFDSGASESKDRITIEKGTDNILKLVVTDTLGNQKWAGIRVDKRNMPGTLNQPGYSDIAATWSNGTLNLYLDTVRGTLSGGTGGTGKLSAPGAYMFIGTDLTGGGIANSTFSYVTIRDGAATETEIGTLSRDIHTLSGPAAPSMATSLPTAGASTTDRTPAFTWGSVSTAVKYRIQVSTVTSFSTVVRDSTQTATSYTPPTALSPGTYYWRVAGYDQYGAGAFSTARSLTVT